MNVAMQEVVAQIKKVNSIHHYLALLMIFVLIFPLGLMNVISSIAIATFVISGGLKGARDSLRGHLEVRPAIYLFILLMIGVTYSSAEMSYALHHLSKYRGLLLFPIAILIFRQSVLRVFGFYIFLVSIGVAVICSYLMKLGLIPVYPNPGEDFAPFKGRISYGFYLAFGIYLMLYQAILVKRKKGRLLWLAFAAVSIFDLLFLVSSRTGHWILITLMVLLVAQNFTLAKRYWLIGLLLFSALFTVTLLFSPAVKSRMDDIKLYKVDPETSSIGQRRLFLDTGLRIIADHPLIGAGTGSFATESLSPKYNYSKLTMNNPHNEYLLITLQLGLIGLMVFLWWFYSQWRLSTQLPVIYGSAAQGLLVAMAVGCLFNSFLRDEGPFFSIFSGLLFSSLEKPLRN